MRPGCKQMVTCVLSTLTWPKNLSSCAVTLLQWRRFRGDAKWWSNYVRSVSVNTFLVDDLCVKDFKYRLLLSRFCLEYRKKYENVLVKHQIRMSVSLSVCLLHKCKLGCVQTSFYTWFFLHESMWIHVHICEYSKVCFFTLFTRK